MIPIDRTDILDAALEILEHFGSQTEVRGRFVALYLGLRRMGAVLPGLGATEYGSTRDIERFLDQTFTKTHRVEPLVVLTALFGQTQDRYKARTGVRAPGHKSQTNTWRNNFGIQKGVGCAADANTIQHMLESPAGRLACPHIQGMPGGGHRCGIRGTNYRGEEHAIWLRTTRRGYQRVNLDHAAVSRGYLTPAGRKIPIFPLIAAIYSFAPADVYPARALVGIPEFAGDFYFTLEQVQALFDCDPDASENANLLARIQGPVWRLVQSQATAVVATTPIEHMVATNALTPPVVGLPVSLPLPSPTGQINTGVGAELAVASELVARGWCVGYRGNQRCGYDLEARRGNEVLRVEVKSSVSFTQPELTVAEWSAAKMYGEEYVLAIVDFYNSPQQSTWYVRNPASTTNPRETINVSYRLVRIELSTLRTEADLL